jgi:hypothetical protein
MWNSTNWRKRRGNSGNVSFSVLLKGKELHGLGQIFL